jgi:hypothetical protein
MWNAEYRRFDGHGIHLSHGVHIALKSLLRAAFSRTGHLLTENSRKRLKEPTAFHV